MPLTLRNMSQTFAQEQKAKMKHALLRPEDMDKKSSPVKEPGAKPDVNARPDTTYKANNSYVLGRTAFDAAKYFGMNAFNQKARIEKDAAMKAEGHTLQKDLAPKSQTATKSLLWEKGPAVAWNTNTWFRPDGDYRAAGLRVSSGGGGRPSTPHPYAGHISQWNALKADAAQLGLTNTYCMPTDHYYKRKDGKPDYLVKADEADQMRTQKNNPPAAAKAPLSSVQEDAAADKREAMASRRQSNVLEQYLSAVPQETIAQTARRAAQEDKTAELYGLGSLWDTQQRKVNREQEAYKAKLEKNETIRRVQAEDRNAELYGLGSYQDNIQSKAANAQKEKGKKSEFIDPLDTLTSEHDAAIAALQADYAQALTPGDMLNIAKEGGFVGKDADADEFQEFLISTAAYHFYDYLETNYLGKLQEEIERKAAMFDLEYMSKYQSLTTDRNAKRFGYDQTLSEHVREEWQKEQQQPGYHSPIFAGSNAAVLGYNPKYMTKEEYATRIIGGEVKRWQAIYENLKAKEEEYKDNTQWQYEMDVAQYNLNVAQAQLEFFKPGFQEKAAAGAADPYNQVTNAAAINDRLSDLSGVGKQGFEAVEFAIKNPAFAYLGYLAGGDIAKSIPNLAYAMYPSEKAIYNAKLVEDPTGASADAYFESIRPSVEHRDYLYTQQLNAGRDGLEDFITDTLGLPFASARTWVTSISALARGERITKDDPRYRDLQEIEQRRGAFTKAITDKYPALSPLVNAGISMADMGVALLYGGGVTGMSFIMAGEAGSSTILDTLERGGDIKTAVTRGVIASAVEYFTERLGTGERFTKLFANPVSARAFWKDFTKSMVAEGVEEIPGWIADGWTDEMMGPLSEAASRYTELVNQYRGKYGEEEAMKMASQQFQQENVGQLLDQMLSAALAGGFGGGFANIAGSINVNSMARKIQFQNPGMEPGLARAIAETRTGYKPLQPALIQQIDRYLKDSAAKNNQTGTLGSAVSSQAPVLADNMIEFDNNADVNQTPLNPVTSPTSEIQEYTPGDMPLTPGQTAANDPLAENVGIQPPSQADIEYIEQLEADGDFAGAAGYRYKTLMGAQ